MIANKRDAKTGQWLPEPKSETERLKPFRLKAQRQRWREYYRRYPEKMKARNAKRYADLTPRQMWELHLWQAYEMTIDDYWALWVKQKGACAICKEPSDWNLVVDHEHIEGKNTRRGKPRGLLCHRCNTGLGKFKDDPRMLRRAAAYVSFYRNR